MNQPSSAAAMKTAADAIRPFHVNFPKEALDDLRRRIAVRLKPIWWPSNRRVMTAYLINHLRQPGVLIALLMVAGSLSIYVVHAHQSGVKRTDLQKHDLSISGREMVQVRVDVAPGVVAPAHSHPGEEIIVIEGTLEYQVQGRPPVTLRAGEVLFVPYGAIHSAKNVGSINAAELATYIVEKGKPLVITAE